MIGTSMFEAAKSSTPNRLLIKISVKHMCPTVLLFRHIQLFAFSQSQPAQNGSRWSQNRLGEELEVDCFRSDDLVFNLLRDFESLVACCQFPGYFTLRLLDRIPITQITCHKRVKSSSPVFSIIFSAGATERMLKEYLNGGKHCGLLHTWLQGCTRLQNHSKNIEAVSC